MRHLVRVPLRCSKTATIIIWHLQGGALPYNEHVLIRFTEALAQQATTWAAVDAIGVVEALPILGALVLEGVFGHVNYGEFAHILLNHIHFDPVLF